MTRLPPTAPVVASLPGAILFEAAMLAGA